MQVRDALAPESFGFPLSSTRAAVLEQEGARGRPLSGLEVAGWGEIGVAGWVEGGGFRRRQGSSSLFSNSGPWIGFFTTSRLPICIDGNFWHWAFIVSILTSQSSVSMLFDFIAYPVHAFGPPLAIPSICVSRTPHYSSNPSQLPPPDFSDPPNII
jgi:hypothetical protein